MHIAAMEKISKNRGRKMVVWNVKSNMRSARSGLRDKLIVLLALFVAPYTCVIAFKIYGLEWLGRLLALHVFFLAAGMLLIVFIVYTGTEKAARQLPIIDVPEVIANVIRLSAKGLASVGLLALCVFELVPLLVDAVTLGDPGNPIVGFGKPTGRSGTVLYDRIKETSEDGGKTYSLMFSTAKLRTGVVYKFQALPRSEYVLEVEVTESPNTGRVLGGT